MLDPHLSRFSYVTKRQHGYHDTTQVKMNKKNTKKYNNLKFGIPRIRKIKKDGWAKMGGYYCHGAVMNAADTKKQSNNAAWTLSACEAKCDGVSGCSAVSYAPGTRQWCAVCPVGAGDPFRVENAAWDLYKKPDGITHAYIILLLL